MSLRIDGGGGSGAIDSVWSPSADANTPDLRSQLQSATAQYTPGQQADLETISQQQDLLKQAYAEADRTGDASLRQQADDLSKLYHDQQMSHLANDAYHHTKTEATTPPVGWSRASEDPATLAKYGLSINDLAPANSNFRAELYIPDPNVFGPDALPVLSYKGTDVSSPVDWANNFTQGVGERTDFYNRAMDLATTVSDRTEGDFELTGHSLGGGMASAASAVTGAPATTFNSAGLHANTAREYLAPMNREPFDVSGRITAYHVDGDVLTGIQQAASGITPHHADQLAAVIRGGIGVAQSDPGQAILGKLGVDVPDLSGLAQATGSDLRNMPLAAGATSVTLPAVNADGSARPGIVPLGGPDGIVARAQNVADVAETYINPLVTIGSLPGNAVSGAGRLVDNVLDAGGRLASNTLDAAGSATNTALDAGAGVLGRAFEAGGNRLNETLDAGGRLIDGTLNAGGNLINGALDAGGNAIDRTLDAGGKAIDGALDASGHFAGSVVDGAGQITGGLLNRIGSLLPGSAGRSVQHAGDAVSTSASGLARTTSSALDRAGDVASNALDKTGGFVAHTFDRAGDVTRNALESAGGFVSRTLDRAGDMAANAMDATGRFTSHTLDRAGDIAATTASQVGSAVDKALDRTGDAVSWLGDKIGGGLRAIGITGVVASPAGLAVAGAGVAHAGITAANDPVLREAGNTLGEMAIRHGGDIVDNGIAQVVSERENALSARLGH
jgi:hypothetical protein